MQVLNGVAYFLAGLAVWLAFAYRKPLAFPQWLVGSEAFAARSGKGAIPRAVGVFLLLLLLDGLPDMMALVMQGEPYGPLGPGFLYVVFFLGGWIAGRFGGRYGLSATLAFLLLRVLIPLVSIPLGLFFIESASKGQVFVERVMEQWVPNFLLLAPHSLTYTLAAAYLGAWQAFGISEDGRRRTEDGGRKTEDTEEAQRTSENPLEI